MLAWSNNLISLMIHAKKDEYRKACTTFIKQHLWVEYAEPKKSRSQTTFRCAYNFLELHLYHRFSVATAFVIIKTEQVTIWWLLNAKRHFGPMELLDFLKPSPGWRNFLTYFGTPEGVFVLLEHGPHSETGIDEGKAKWKWSV